MSLARYPLGNILLSKNKQDTSHIFNSWHGILAGNLILISIIMLCWAIFCSYEALWKWALMSPPRFFTQWLTFETLAAADTTVPFSAPEWCVHAQYCVCRSEPSTTGKNCVERTIKKSPIEGHSTPKCLDFRIFKTLDTIGNCQRLLFTVGVS